MSIFVTECFSITEKINLSLHIYPGKSESIILLHGGPGGYDLFVSSERALQRRFPQAQEVWFEESGHFPWIEEPEKFKRVIGTFYTPNAYSGKE
ncbi:hypothetical protein KDA_67260 [Dictyobacter alpinus]|uniref:AB hydrolase-1 domain-containing protein n=1 Tax=Dictyobacter alpinus TaxID=2014873 RepID=A0A402BJ29_9CHLR|nr:alpha/beta hydrolase [Dictyobacter alpinus]GCE31242.1 hypothetical protein KDA_67260 [Dictyobacter alpinus]